MAPFLNKGWPYLEKFEDIMPNASARGGNAFSAMRTGPPVPLNDTLDNPTTATSALQVPAIDESSTSDSAGNTLINPIMMDIDHHGSDTASISTSNSFGKRKLEVITSDEELKVSGNLIPSSNPSPITSEMPAKKKSSSISKPLPRSKHTSSTHSSQPRAQLTSTKMTPALIAHEIQGSINSLASAVRESGSTDPVAKLRQEAIHHVSGSEDGFSGTDKIAIIDLFRKDYAAVQTYIALLEHDDLRRPWLEKQLQELKN